MLEPRSARTSGWAAGVVIAIALAGPGRHAHANPMSLAPSAASTGTPSLFHVTVDYDYSIESAKIRRETFTGDPLGGIGATSDLKFEQFSHRIIPRMELGILRDSWISFAVPVTVAQARELSLDDGVTRDTSTTIRDGLLTADGFDARDPGTPLPGGGDLIFRGENRRGVSQLWFGLGVAPMNQDRDDTKPTWKLGAELRLAVGKVMRFDAMRTASETGVSKGVHELKLWSTFARRFPRTEGYFEMYWLVPLTAREVSLFDDIDQTPGNFGARNTLPGQKGGISFGLEVYALDDRVNHNRISLDAGARVVGHFEGRDYSEMWEVFALAGDVRRSGPLVMDRNPVEPDIQAESHPGITNIENYLETAVRFGIRGQLAKRIHFGLMFDLAWRTDHNITFADAGVDLPTCSGSSTVDCETDANDLVNPGTQEVNPLHVPAIDLVGHRYRSVDGFTFQIGVQAQALF